jgi:hypothetical protein
VSLRTQPAAIINIASCGGKSYILPIVELSGGIASMAAGGCLMVTTRTIRSLSRSGEQVPFRERIGLCRILMQREKNFQKMRTHAFGSVPFVVDCASINFDFFKPRGSGACE